MSKQSQQELVDHLRSQFEINRKALHDLREVSRKLEVMNQKLQESEQLKSHFLSNIRNEITNPLTAIMGLSSRLLAGENDPQRLPAIARMIYEEAFSLDFQLQNIFAAAELEAGEAAPSWAQVEVSGVLAGVLSLIEPRIAHKGLTIRRDFAPSIPFVTDARKLHLMLINLLANAVEFSPQGGGILVSARVTEDGLEIIVQDHGPGIAQDDQEVIFDRFRQLDTGPSKGHRGHGLGLSITRALAEGLGGSVTLHSELGAGALFCLALPEPESTADVLAPEGNLFLFGSGERF